MDYILTQLSTPSSAGISTWLKFPALLQRLGAPARLISVLRDVHFCTWMNIAGQSDYCRTRRGTRPGSPLADMIFHILMLDATLALESWLAEDGPYQQLLTTLGIEIGAVVWSDDLAVPYCCGDPGDLPAAMERILQKVYVIFQQRGFDLNLNKNKTSAVVSCGGTGAAKLRLRYNLSDPPGMDIMATPQSPALWLHFVPVYKHLGIMYSADSSWTAELNHRLGMANSAFIASKRSIFCNRTLPLKIRLNLYKALVTTRLFYGFGLWPAPSLKMLDKIQHLMGRHLKAMMFTTKAPDQAFPTDVEVFDKARFPLPRVRLALDRLLLAQALFANGPHFLRKMVQAEHAHSPDDSWISGLQADLSWAHSLSPNFVPETWLTTLTPAFEYWEANSHPWKLGLRALLRVHLHQERMMHKIHRLHRNIFKVFRANDALVRPDPLQSMILSTASQQFECHCHRSFTTPRVCFERRCDLPSVSQAFLEFATTCSTFSIRFEEDWTE